MGNFKKYQIGPIIRRLGEPPQFDYDMFIDEEVPSDTRMKILFPDDIEMRTNYRDALTEYRLLYMYMNSVEDNLEATKDDPHRDKFYGKLQNEVEQDYEEVYEEFLVLDRQVPQDTFQMWEYENLDQDGATKKLEEAVSRGQSLFEYETPEVVQAIIEKYGHLIPREHRGEKREQRLEAWEETYLDADGGTTELERRIAAGEEDSIFARDVGGIEAKQQYGYLLEIPRDQLRLRVWEKCFLDHDGGTTHIQKIIARGKGDWIFNSDDNMSGEEARAKYGYLLEECDLPAINTLESIRNQIPNAQSSTTTSSTTDILESTRELCPNSSPPRVKHDKPETTVFHTIRNLFIGTQALAAKHDTSSSGIFKSSRDLLLATTKQEDSKHKHLPLTTVTKSSSLPITTVLTLIASLALELFLIYHAYKEWMTWYE